MWLIRYYKSPYSMLISLTLNHKLWLRSILHPFTWVSNQLHISVWKLSFVTTPSLKTPNPYFMSYHLLWNKQLVLVGLSFVFRTHLSNIRFQYGVFVSPTYSSPFSRLSHVCFSITYPFASKFNCRVNFG